MHYVVRLGGWEQRENKKGTHTHTEGNGGRGGGGGGFYSTAMQCAWQRLKNQLDFQSDPALAGITGQVQQGRRGGGDGAWRAPFQGPSRGSREGKRVGEARFRTPGRALALTRLAGLENYTPTPRRHGAALPLKNYSVNSRTCFANVPLVVQWQGGGAKQSEWVALEKF
jgi:hypothetical protein